MERRTFVAASTAGVASLAGAQRPLPKRPYKKGIDLSVIGFGGIVVVGMEPGEAASAVSRAVDRGVNYFDVAPSYWDGEAERKLGVALEPHRKNVFLACKTTRRDGAGAKAELEESLRRMRTGHFDLYQFHAVTTQKDVDGILAPGGAGETFRKAREAGQVRHVGASAHSMEAAIALMDAFPLDSILFPVNFALFSNENFGPRLLAHAKQKGVTRLALKALSKQANAEGQRIHPKCWYEPITDRALAEKALRFTLSEEVTAAIPPGVLEIFEMSVELAASFTPLSAAERNQILAEAKGLRSIFKQG